MAKLLRPLVIVLFLLSIVALVLGVMLFTEREALKGRADKFVDGVQRVADILTEGRDPHVEAIEERLREEQLTDYERMDAPLNTLAAIAQNRHQALFNTRDDLKKTNDELDATRQELAQSRQDLANARDEIARLETRVAEKDREIAQANRRVADLESANAGLQEEVTALNDRIVLVEEEKRGLEDQITSLEQRIAALVPDTQQIATPTPEGLTGEILLVNPVWNFVVLNLGADDELAPQSELLVHRDDHLVGKIRVSQVEDDLAVAEIVRDWEKLPLRKGDQVFFTGS
jgi:uncharacterized coiled-coil protein SlyX